MKIFKKVIAGVAALAIAVSGISFGAMSRKEAKAATTRAAAETLGSEYSDAWKAYLSSSSESLQDVDLTGIDSAKVYACVVDLNYGWNGMQIYTNGGSWVQKAYGGSEKTDSDVTLETTGEFVATVPVTPNEEGWFEIGFGYTTADVFILYGIELYAGDTYLGTYIGDTFNQRKVQSTIIGSEYADAWKAYVNNSSEIFKNYDLSGANNVKVDMIVTDLNYGWNGMQIYTNGGSWVQKAYGGSEKTDSDVTLEATGTFAVTVPVTPNEEGWFEIGFGYTTADAFIILSMDFYQGDKLLGSIVGDTFYPNATLELSESSATLKNGDVYNITTTSASTTPVEFSSDNAEVASVDENGKVTAITAGTANITVKDAFGNVSVFVVDVEAIKPSNITIADVDTDVKGGDTARLSATVTPDNALDKTVIWSSSDTEVATVDANGKVTFANVTGTKTVTITAAAKADAAVKATVTFTVEELVIDTPVTGVSIPSELEIIKGEYKSVTATIIPAEATLKSVTWESADESIATVDADGKITAVGLGKTKVTVKTVDGGFTKDCEVTVVAPKASSVKVSVDGNEIDNLEMTVGDEKELTAKAEPDGAVQEFTFTTSDAAVVTVDENGVVKAVAAGTAVITVSADGAETEIEVTVEEKTEPKPPAGDITVVGGGDFKPTIEMSKEEVVDAIKNVLSEEQLAAIEDGTANIEIELNIANIDSTVSDEDKALIDEAIKNIADSDKLNFMVMNYLDITFGANVDGDVIKISETDGMITVSVALEKAVNGTYKVVRIHDGKAEVIDSELSEDGTRLTFNTDKFSTYAIVFADVASGDTTPFALIALIAAAGLAAVLTVTVKLRKTARQ